VRLTASEVASDEIGVLVNVCATEAACVALFEVMDAMISMEEARTLRAIEEALTPLTRAARRIEKLLRASAPKASMVSARVKGMRTTGLYVPRG